MRSATGAGRRWHSILLWPGRLAPVGCTAWFGVGIRVPVGKENIGPHKQEQQDKTKNPNTTLTTIRQSHATKKPRHQDSAPADTP